MRYTPLVFPKLHFERGLVLGSLPLDTRLRRANPPGLLAQYHALKLFLRLSALVTRGGECSSPETAMGKFESMTYALRMSLSWNSLTLSTIRPYTPLRPKARTISLLAALVTVC